MVMRSSVKGVTRMGRAAVLDRRPDKGHSKPDQHTTGHRRFTNKPGHAPGFSFEPADAKAP